MVVRNVASSQVRAMKSTRKSCPCLSTFCVARVSKSCRGLEAVPELRGVKFATGSAGRRAPLPTAKVRGLFRSGAQVRILGRNRTKGATDPRADSYRRYILVAIVKLVPVHWVGTEEGARTSVDGKGLIRSSAGCPTHGDGRRERWCAPHRAPFARPALGE